MGDKRSAKQDIHVEEAFAIQRFRDFVAGLFDQTLLFFRKGGAFFSPDDEEAIRPVSMLEGHSKQRFCARRNQAKANGASALLIVRWRQGRDGGGRQSSENGLNIPWSEASGGMTDERALVAVEQGGERGVDR
jgi:hypothetical protein